jgi:hypothetical protein
MERVGRALGKTLSVKLSLRDPGGKTRDSLTPSHLQRRSAVPNPQALLQLLFRDPQLLRKPMARIEGDCR